MILRRKKTFIKKPQIKKRRSFILRRSFFLKSFCVLLSLGFLSDAESSSISMIQWMLQTESVAHAQAHVQAHVSSQGPAPLHSQSGSRASQGRTVKRQIEKCQGYFVEESLNQITEDQWKVLGELLQYRYDNFEGKAQSFENHGVVSASSQKEVIENIFSRLEEARIEVGIFTYIYNQYVGSPLVRNQWVERQLQEAQRRAKLEAQAREHEVLLEAEREREREIIEKYGEVGSVDKTGSSPFHSAARANDVDAVRFYIQKGENPYNVAFFGLAIDRVTNPEIKSMLEEYMNAHPIDEFIDRGWNPRQLQKMIGNFSFYAGYDKYRYLAAYVIRHRRPELLDSQGEHNRTALHWAVNDLNKKAFQMLLELGANPYIIDQFNKIALDRSEDADITSKLREYMEAHPPVAFVIKDWKPSVEELGLANQYFKSLFKN